jgi:hypothetical protein
MRLSKHYTLDDVVEFIKVKDNVQLADAYIERLRERYIYPFNYHDEEYIKQHKNGFAIVACLCLLIESLIIYQNDFPKIPYKKSSSFYKLFFNDNSKYLAELSQGNFYEDVRCGILHKGETQNDWKIRRDGKFVDNKIINANIFLKRMDNLLIDLKEELKHTPIKSQLWQNIIKKLEKIS